MTSSWRLSLAYAYRALRTLACGVLLLFPGLASAASLTLAWDAAPSSAVRGYVVSYGASAGAYATTVDVGNVTSSTIGSLNEGATYHFAVQAYDAGGIRSPYSNDLTVTVAQITPVAAFTASTTSGPAPLALNFINQSTGSITTYSWSFGDGTTSTVQNPTKVYSSAGTYTVSLTVSGSGGSNTRTVPGYVTVSGSADSTPPSTPPSLTATAIGTSQVDLGWSASTDNVGVTGYHVERCQGAGCTTFARIASVTSNAYSNTGLTSATTYRYRVYALDAAGNISGYSPIATATAGSSTAAPVADFSSNVTSGTTPLAVAFTSTSTGSISSYAWTFGDGTTSTAQNPTKTYANAGVYTVALTVTGPGGSNTVTKSGYVTVATPGSGGSLAGTVGTRSGDVDITSVGAADWAAWAANVRKSGGTGAIAAFSVIGSALPTGYSGDRRKLAWTDGTPTASGTTSAGVEIPAAADKGFRITVPANTTTQTLTLYVGGVSSSGKFTATLSDGSATAYASPAVGNRWGGYDATLTLTFRAASPGQTLTVTWLADGTGTTSSSGRRGSKNPTVRLQGAALR